MARGRVRDRGAASRESERESAQAEKEQEMSEQDRERRDEDTGDNGGVTLWIYQCWWRSCQGHEAQEHRSR